MNAAREQALAWPSSLPGLKSGTEETARDADGDSALIGRVLGGERECFELIVARYESPLFGYLQRLTRSREDAEDLAQETFVRAFQHLGDFDQRRPFRPWLFRIATNAAVSALRKRKVIVSLDAAGPEMEALPASRGLDPRRCAERSELREKLAAAVESLPPAVAAVVQLHYREQMPIAEIAAIAGKREGAIKVALHRARAKLRDMVFGPEPVGPERNGK
ncbi:RNA polymerase sigma factor [Candidatus Poribacteria bacterium]|nr:RNA polymerase sigma factor [Candidatus Poribacteria bacterium]